MVFIEKMFTNECEKEKDGFDEIGYQIFFVVWIIAYWLNVINFVVNHRYKLPIPLIIYGCVYTYYLYHMFRICRPWTGIFIPFLISMVLVLFLGLGFGLYVMISKRK